MEEDVEAYLILLEKLNSSIFIIKAIKRRMEVIWKIIG